MGQSIKLQENTYWDVSSIRVVKTVLSADTDLDDYVGNGIYYFDSDHTPLHAPTGNENGWLAVISEQALNEGRGSGYAKQFWYRGGTSAVNDFQTYVRTCNLGVMYWSPWKRLLVEKDCFYTYGDKYANSAIVYLGGLITGGGTSICTSLTVPKRLDKIVSIAVNRYDLTVRTAAGGEILNRATDGYTVTALKADDSNVQLTITAPSALSEADFTPVAVAIYGLSLTFYTE